MPIYDFRCKKCEQVKEYHAKIEEKEKTCECGGDMVRLITTNVMVSGDLEPYLDWHIGKEPVYIKSKKHRQAVMKREGVSEAYGKGWI